MIDGEADNIIRSEHAIDMDRVNSELNQLTPEQDAGVRAGDALRRRSAAQRAARYALWALVLTLVSLVLGVAGLVYYGYKNAVSKEVTDSRPCKLKVGDHLVTGVREYTRTEYRSMGLSFTKADEIEEVTKLDVELS